MGGAKERLKKRKWGEEVLFIVQNVRSNDRSTSWVTMLEYRRGTSEFDLI